MTGYTNTAVNSLIDRYIQKGGEMITIYGCLVDNYLLFGEGLKTFVIKENCLNEWSSDQTIRAYNKTPEKYKKVIDLYLDDEYDEAEKLFFK